VCKTNPSNSNYCKPEKNLKLVAFRWEIRLLKEKPLGADLRTKYN